MKRQKYISMTAALLALLLIFVPAVYASSGATGAADTSQGVITAIKDGDGLPVESSYAVTIQANDSSALDELLTSLIRMSMLFADGSSSTMWVTDWEYPPSGEDGLYIPGKYTQNVSLPITGYTFADGVPQTVTLVITVTETAEQDPDVIASFVSLEHCCAYAIPQGSDWQEFWDAQFSDSGWEWICYTDEGETLYAEITWDNPMPDTSKTGIVTLTGTAVLPEDTVLGAGVSLPTVEVPVSIQGTPTLDCWYAGYNSIHIPWIIGESDCYRFRLLCSVNGGEWESVSDWTYLDWIDADEGSVTIWPSLLEKDTIYQIKFAWEGGETNVFQFIWDGSVTDAGPYEGDRDGGDSDGNPSNDISQPAPDAPQESEPGSENGTDSENGSESENVSDTRQENGSVPDSETASSPNDKPNSGSDTKSAKDSGREPESPSASVASSAAETKSFTEEVTDTYSKLSGTRLAMMRQTGAVRFSKQGVTVTLSDASLDAMNLTDGSRFLIEVKKTRHGFSLAVTLDGEAVTALPDTLVQVPFTPTDDGSSIALLDEQGGIVCYGVYDAETGIVSFTIHEPSRYTIMETGDETAVTSKISAEGTSAPEQKTELSGPLLPVIILSMAALLIGLFCFRRRLR